MADLIDAIKAAVRARGPIARVVPGVRASSAIARYVEDVTNILTLRTELSQLGYHGVQLDRLVLAATLDRDLAVRKRERAPRRSTIGLVLRTETRQMRSTIGLKLRAGEGTQVVPERRQRSTIGLALRAAPAPRVPQDRRRRSTIGLRLRAG